MYLFHQHIRQAATDGHPGTWTAYRQNTVHREGGTETYRQIHTGRLVKAEAQGNGPTSDLRTIFIQTFTMWHFAQNNYIIDDITQFGVP